MASRAPVGEFRWFSTALSSAVFEWILMFLLFFDALFSYMVTKFSRLCKLQAPCIFCSRLDHIFGKDKPGFYLDLICETHRSEISSLVFCHVHGKLADVHNMCEDCLLSFASKRKSTPETYRSLVVKLRGNFDDSEDVQAVDSDGLNAFHGDDLANAPLLKKDGTTWSPVSKNCSCCTKPCQNKLQAIRLLEDKSIRVDAAGVDISLLSSVGLSCLHNEDGTRKIREETLVSPNLRNQGFDRVSHIGFNEVKITPVSDSENLVIDNAEGRSLAHGVENIKDDLLHQIVESESVAIIKNSLSGRVSDNKAVEKLIHSASVNVSDDKALKKSIDSAPFINGPSESAPMKQISLDELHDITTFSSSNAAGHFLEDSNWDQIKVKAIPPQSELVPQVLQEVLVEDSNVKDNLELNDAACVHTTIDDAKEWCATDNDLGTSHDASDPGQSMSNHMDLNDAYKLAVGTKGSLTSPRFTEVIMGKDSSRVQEDLKLLISHISASQGLESPWHEMSPSPRVYGQGDESVLQNITKTLSLDRNESGLESLDGSIVSEVEGESAFERLKRQVELDRKSISLLYKELEEERSASAIAANQAMAMITRLQEEKAAMQMEALHYQRMMEEQAEYDHEALQKCNELLTQREKEMQDLEAEVENYTKRFTDELFTNKVVEQNGNFHDKEIAFCKKSGETRVMYQESRRCEFGSFEDEKAYITKCLKKLEKKLHLFSTNGISDDGSSISLNDDDENVVPGKICTNVQGEDFVGGLGTNGQYSDEVAVAGLAHLHKKNGPLENSQMEENILLEERISRKSSSSFQGNHGDNSDMDKQYLLKVGNRNALVALENEVSWLSQRLEALEADRNFLEYAINSLRNGEDGVRFIQEIACDLRELRGIEITRREHLMA